MESKTRVMSGNGLNLPTAMSNGRLVGASHPSRNLTAGNQVSQLSQVFGQACGLPNVRQFGLDRAISDPLI